MMEEKTNFIPKESSTDLKHKTIGSGLIVVIILLVIVGATVAWYIYNTSIHTTKVHMAAGTSTKLEISDAYDGEYSTAVDMSSFYGVLNPVSTDKITNGFQVVTAYEDDPEVEDRKIASIFGPAFTSDYFMTSLFVRTNASTVGIYACTPVFSEELEAQLMATALRIGFVIHEPGENTSVQSEYIFIMSDEENPSRDYNTKQGSEGYVLDSTKTDGSVVLSPEHKLDEFITYNRSTGNITKGDNALKLFDLVGGEGGLAGTPVQIDVYLWLEGCDPDCTFNLANSVLQDLAVTFVGL